MSVPPELMAMLSGGGKGGPPPAGPGGPTPGVGPAGAPMAGPAPAEGDKQNAMINIGMAMDLLEHSLPSLGSESEEGSLVVDVLRLLGKKFGTQRTKSQDLIPAELMQLMSALPQAGGMSPEAKAMQAGPKPPMPGGMPPGMPH